MKSLLIILFLFGTVASLCAQNNVGIGTPVPQASLHIVATDTGMLRLENTTTLASGVSNAIYFKTGNYFTGGIKQTGTGTVFSRTGFLGFASINPSGLKEYLSITDAGNVGIGTTTPNAKAVLDITSTTQGLLPPRMNSTQRNAIISPPQGLMIYCTDCGAGEPEYYNGTAWVNMLGDPAIPVLVIGDNYKGGKVAYILQPGDPGYIAGQVHGLIAAASDQSTFMQWYNGSLVTGATATVLGTGNANTNTIVAAQGAGSYAAKLCYDLVLNGYSDWYLPGKDELNKLYLNRIAIGGFANNNTEYWSSSEFNQLHAWSQDFTNGAQSNGFFTKNDMLNVRAVRAF